MSVLNLVCIILYEGSKQEVHGFAPTLTPSFCYSIVGPKAREEPSWE